MLVYTEQVLRFHFLEIRHENLDAPKHDDENILNQISFDKRFQTIYDITFKLLFSNITLNVTSFITGTWLHTGTNVWFSFLIREIINR